MSDTTTNFCVWEDCDQEASYCEGHAHELVNPLGREFAPPAIEVNEDGVVTDKSQDADWLRARFFERSAEVEKLEERIELATAEGEAKDQRIAELEAVVDTGIRCMEQRNVAYERIAELEQALLRIEELSPSGLHKNSVFTPNWYDTFRRAQAIAEDTRKEDKP